MTRRRVKKPEDIEPKLSIVITREQRKKLYELLPWGLQGRIFRAVVDDVIYVLENAKAKGLSAMVVAAIESEQIRVRSIAPFFKQSMTEAGLTKPEKTAGE